jgi:hypothetical protein
MVKARLHVSSSSGGKVGPESFLAVRNCTLSIPQRISDTPLSFSVAVRRRHAQKVQRASLRLRTGKLATGSWTAFCVQPSCIGLRNFVAQFRCCAIRPQRASNVSGEECVESITQKGTLGGKTYLSKRFRE